MVALSQKSPNKQIWRMNRMASERKLDPEVIKKVKEAAAAAKEEVLSKSVMDALIEYQAGEPDRPRFRPGGSQGASQAIGLLGPLARHVRPLRCR